MKHHDQTMPSSFNDHYQSLFNDRWAELAHAFSQDETKNNISQTQNQYCISDASLLVAQTLAPKPGEVVLDMCAAPGGKSIVLASLMSGEGELIANDRSAKRRGRLKENLRECLSPQCHSIIQVTGHDSSRWGLYEQDRYDRILLDAPCSSERHVLSDERALKEWTPSRSKRLALNQVAMLCAALDAVKVGGVIIYSTCALHPQENDGAIEKFLKKRKDKVGLKDLAFPIGESTMHGWQFWPDKCQGIGPIYLCKLIKL